MCVSCRDRGHALLGKHIVAFLRPIYVKSKAGALHCLVSCSFQRRFVIVSCAIGSLHATAVTSTPGHERDLYSEYRAGRDC